MTRDELLEKLRQGEDGFVERKAKGHRSAVLETMVAFANSVPPGREAVLFIGQRSDKRIVGVEDADKLQLNVAEWAKRESFPPVVFQCEVIREGEAEVVAVVVPASHERPHFAGHAYKRVGSKTVKASAEMLDELVAGRNTKAGKILRHKGERITVDFQVREPERWAGAETITTRAEDCIIENCSVHSVELNKLGSNRVVSISLDRVIITKDVKNHRPLRLKVRPEP